MEVLIQSRVTEGILVLATMFSFLEGSLMVRIPGPESELGMINAPKS